MKPTAAVSLSILLLAAAPSLPAVDPPLQATSEDINVRGFTGETLYAHTTIANRTKDQEIVLRWQSFPDQTPGSTRAIEAPQVSIAPQEAVAGGTKQTFGITISSVKDAGRYVGDIEIYDKKSGRSLGSRRLSIDVRRAPTYSAVPAVANATPQLVKCRGLDCSFAAWLLRRRLSPVIPEFASVRTTNLPTGTGLRPGEIVARGINTLVPVTRDAVVPGEAVAKADRLVVPATVNLDALQPDQYAGSMLVSIDGQPEPMSLPIAFSVRNGPLVPALLLLVGLGIAWLVQWIDTKGQPQINVLRRADRVVYGLSAADAALLAHQILDVQRKAYRFDLTAADAQMTRIENRATLLLQLERLEADAQKLGDPSVAAAMTVAREAIRQEDDATATAKIDEIRKALYAAATSARTTKGMIGGPTASVLDAHADRLGMTGARLEASPRRTSLLRRTSASLSDWFAEARANLVQHVVRPLFFVLVVVLLLAGGLWALWIKNPSFGASPLADYVSVLTWGMGANIATKTLANLQSMFAR